MKKLLKSIVDNAAGAYLLAKTYTTPLQEEAIDFSRPKPKCYDAEEVLALEASVLAVLPPCTETNYFKQPVALHLYRRWVEDNNNRDLLIYSFPLIEAIMHPITHKGKMGVTMGNFTHRSQLIKTNEIEIFNELCIVLINLLPKIDVEKGKIFSYFTFVLSNRLKSIVAKMDKEGFASDELPELECLTDSYYLLEDFKSFLAKYALQEGKTANRIIDAFLSTLNNTEASNLILISQSQGNIIAEIVRKTDLPIELVEPYYKLLLKKYETHDLIY